MKPPNAIDAPMPAIGPAFTIAFQPIVDLESREVFAHEALVRGARGEGALEVLGKVQPPHRFAFHEACRVKAIEMASMLGMQSRLSLNVAPNDVAGPTQCFHTAIRAAEQARFPVDRLMFELTEGEPVADLPALAASFNAFEGFGFTSAIDDFGAAYAGFELLAAFQPDIVKLDMSFVRDVHRSAVRFAIVKGIVAICDELRIRVVAEGVERPEEVDALRGVGVRLFQGFLFAAPGVAMLPAVAWNAV
ncbi:EAL domain-containing protein [Variovorax guangxiensis]|uniref:EAL domain-containing protein n=1 Tax=Variovorax guangxiensis TaxID=1775474 RepID=UPI00286594A6|nr:EAL domain-containing protein [Variovorax guangxiensis]MDR6855821.1 EAL domain-containing protein (putative c-di-GMP-specific phosphodiesterase class I) [Variovorax guangxiensis]